MKGRMLSLAVMLAGAVLAVGCESSPAPKSRSATTTLQQQTQTALQEFKNRDPSLDRFFNSSYAYVIFPDVTAGGLVVGGAYGKGMVYRQGQFVGYADISQASVGAQAGGQSYSELIFLENEGSFADFKQGKTAFDARATAVAASNGAAATANYERGVAVFTLPKGGLMAQATIGGQKFNYIPKEDVNRTAQEE